MSIVGLLVLMVLSEGEPWRTASFAIYGVSSVTLYTASTLLHSLRVREQAERWLLRFDHAAIFIMIAGSYTPITLVMLREHSPAWGWTLFGIVWGNTVLGVIFKLFWLDAPRWLSTGLYLLMGWLAVVATGPLIDALPTGGLIWLVVGGSLLFGRGAGFYLRAAQPLPWRTRSSRAVAFLGAGRKYKSLPDVVFLRAARVNMP